MEIYKVTLKMKLSKYPRWIIGYIEEGLEKGEAVVEYDITPDFEEKDLGGGLKKRIKIREKTNE